MRHEKLLIIDYGSQYTQLIARRARELGVLAEVCSWNIDFEKIRDINPKAIILSGGPASVTDSSAPTLDGRLLDFGIPILGVCYGMQLLAHALGGTIRQSHLREYGVAKMVIKQPGILLSGIPTNCSVWASHGDDIQTLPHGFVPLAVTETKVLAAAEDNERKIYVIQFHPEVTHTEFGREILSNFLFTVCGFKGDWQMSAVIEEVLHKIKEQVGNDNVLCALSGGVDSSVVAAMLHRSIPGQVAAVFVDHGLLRLNEAKQVKEAMKEVIGSDLIVINAKDRFLGALRGMADPEEKRKIIGRQFIEIFEQYARQTGNIKYLAQGTLYPDVIESSGTGGPAATIKSHHNVGGLPEKMSMRLVEPVRQLFKDEVRELGKLLGLPASIVSRHPFPGPGLAVRILGPITNEALDTLALADDIFINELRTDGLYDQVWQAFAVLLPIRTVGVMGDGRTYDQVIALRAVTSIDGMTADWARLPDEFLARVSSKIINEVKGVNRVVYDISSKPPATIEWE